LENALGVRQHVIVPESQNAPAVTRHELVSRRIASGFGVLPSIDFDDYASIDAREVCDIGRDRMLPAKGPTFEPLVAKTIP
jgi:hypothetical protein